MKPAPSLLASCLLVLLAGHAAATPDLHPRQLLPGKPSDTPTPTPPPATSKSDSSSAPSTPTSNPNTSNTANTSTSQNTQNTQNNTPTGTPTIHGPTNTNTDTITPGLPTNAPTVVVPTTSLSVSFDPAGSAVTVTVTGSATITSSSPSPTETKKADDNGGGGGFGTGSIIGVSVAGGVALIAIIAFFVWKFTRKRFTDFDDNEAIKWPELNTHGENPTHALPTHNTGRAGFDTGSEASLSRVPSTNYSTPDVASTDPYAVPPLPHMNPNQPYRDDPAAATGYYDPYRGPIPGTLEHGHVDDYGEAIPMTQMGGGPQAAYAIAGAGGRNSPAPYAAGRNSPGPQMAYGGGGRASPAPQAAYNVGRASPGPHAAYGQR